MSIRTTSTEVLELMDSDCDVSTAVITRMIIAASAIVDKVFEGDQTMTDTLLEEIECWLTAHMITSTLYRMATEEKVGDAQIKYMGKFGEGLKSTPYGQMVLTLDVTGKMAKVGLKGVSVYAIPNFND